MSKKSDKTEKRETWSNPVEFFLTLVSYCVGPGNILRFPYLCMKNGGSAFLVPYFICLFLCGVPLYTLELIMGQASRRGCVGCWTKYGRIFKGIGYTMILITGVCLFEYQTYMAWILYYFARSLTLELPWTTCNGTWNTPDCISTTDTSKENNEVLDNTLYNATSIGRTMNATLNSTVEKSTAVEEFFQNHVLQLSAGIDDVGILQWHLCIAHIIGWMIMVLCLAKGIRSSGKVVYVSATLPYVIITVFLVRAAMLPGFMDGILLYTTPNYAALMDIEVWMMGFLQIFFSLGPGWGCMISMSSFSAYKHNFLWEAFFCPIVCCLTSFYSGFVTFGAAGFLAHVKGLPVEQAMKSGPGIAFISFPELASHLPGGPIWSALFFLMLFNVLLGSQLVQLEACVSALVDAFNLPKRYHKYVLLAYSLVNLLIGLVLFTSAGMYILQIVDWYFAMIIVFVTTTCECVCVMWIYGFERFSNDIVNMIGRRPPKFIILPLLGVIIPLISCSAFVWSVAKVAPPQYGSYAFPYWCEVFGWILAFSMLAPCIVYILVKLVKISGPDFRGKFSRLLRSEWKPEESECVSMDDEVDAEKLMEIEA